MSCIDDGVGLDVADKSQRDRIYSLEIKRFNCQAQINMVLVNIKDEEEFVGLSPGNLAFICVTRS